MTRLLLAVLIASTFLCAVLYAHHRTAPRSSAVVVPPSAGLARAGRGDDPVLLSHRPPRPRQHACTDTHWKRTLGKQERWIDAHESGLNPASREPSTGAFGLGQLEPQTYARLGLPMDPSPCREIQAQRAYMVERYGTWGNALAHWRAVSWW